MELSKEDYNSEAPVDVAIWESGPPMFDHVLSERDSSSGEDSGEWSPWERSPIGIWVGEMSEEYPSPIFPRM